MVFTSIYGVFEQDIHIVLELCLPALDLVGMDIEL